MIPRLLTVFDVADWLHMPALRVRRMAKLGKLPCITSADGEILFVEADLAAWVESRRRPSQQEAASGK